MKAADVDDDASLEGYYVKDGTRKGYVPASDVYESVSALKDKETYVYVANTEKDYVAVNYASLSWGTLNSPDAPPVTERFAHIPGGYIQLINADDYKLAITEGGAGAVYYYNYMTQSMVEYTSSASTSLMGDDFYPYGEGVGAPDGQARLYISFADIAGQVDKYGDLLARNYELVEGVSAPEDANLEEWIREGEKYFPDGNGAYVVKNVFNDYTTLLDLDLGQIISFKDGELVADTENILDVLSILRHHQLDASDDRAHEGRGDG